MDAAAQRAALGWVLADAEFDSEANHQHIRQRCRAQSIIPAQPRRGVPRGGLRLQMHRKFPQKRYGQRAKIETIFSVVKRKLSSRAPGRSLRSQIRQALLLGLTYNLYRLRRPNVPLGCQQIHFNLFIMNTCGTIGVASLNP
ncbi:MAG: transposase [Candidatus Acidiferrum sp.]